MQTSSFTWSCCLKTLLQTSSKWQTSASIEIKEIYWQLTLMKDLYKKKMKQKFYLAKDSIDQAEEFIS